ncbi:MAG: hypothetical protein ABIK84_06445 [candidate division WOR-3 bacterium]
MTEKEMKARDKRGKRLFAMSGREIRIRNDRTSGFHCEVINHKHCHCEASFFAEAISREFIRKDFIKVLRLNSRI